MILIELKKNHWTQYIIWIPRTHLSLFHVFRRHSTERSVGYLPVFITVGCGDQKTRNNGNMLSFAQQNFKYSLQTREKTSWKTLGGFATSCFSLGFFSRLSVNICQYRFADHSILPQYSVIKNQPDLRLQSRSRSRDVARTLQDLRFLDEVVPMLPDFDLILELTSWLGLISAQFRWTLH